MSTSADSDFDPYHKWLGIPTAEQPANHYRLLGLTEFEDDPDVIAAAADRQMSHVKSFATGRYGSYSQELLNELAKVRVCLLNPKLKPTYDAELRRKLAPRPAAPPPATGTTSKATAPVGPPAPAPPAAIRGPRIATVREPADPMAALSSLKRPRAAILRRKRKRHSTLPIVLGVIIIGIAIVGVLLYYANRPM